MHVEIWEAPDRLEVNIEDSGPGFDPDKLEFPPPITDPERLNFERGLGIPLIRTLVDHAAFIRKEKGTSVRMTVFGGPADGDDTGGDLHGRVQDVQPDATDGPGALTLLAPYWLDRPGGRPGLARSTDVPWAGRSGRATLRADGGRRS